MNTITNIVRIEGWKPAGALEELGDISGMVPEEPIHTVQSGRQVLVRAWINPDTGDGYEEVTTTLMEGEQ